MRIILLVTTLLASSSRAAGQASEAELLSSLERAQNGYEVAEQSEAFAALRTTAAMEARLALYPEKLTIPGGVHLRDWLYTGMLRAETAEECALLAEAAADRRAHPLLRMVCLRALRRGQAPVPGQELLDRRLQRAAGELGRAWQNTVGKLLAEGRLIPGKRQSLEDFRAALLESGAPFVGHRWLGPLSEELGPMRDGWRSCKDPADRAQMLYSLASLAGQDPAFGALYLGCLEQALADPAHAPRAAATGSVLRSAHHAAAPILIQALTRAQPTARVTQDLATTLRRLTGQQFGARPEAWERWWAASGAEWLTRATAEGGLAGDAIAPPEEDLATVASVFGIPIDSARVGFLVDGSGSMNEILDDGRRCAEAAADEFEAFLARFPEDGIFHLRVIVRETQSPFDEAVAATRRNRERAIDFVRRFDFGPASSMYDALLEAQTDPEIDTLVFVSDGGGSWGSFAYPGHMLDGLSLAAERSGVRIHTICVGKSRNKARFMEQLADLSGGKMTGI